MLPPMVEGLCTLACTVCLVVVVVVVVVLFGSMYVYGNSKRQSLCNVSYSKSTSLLQSR